MQLIKPCVLFLEFFHASYWWEQVRFLWNLSTFPWMWGCPCTSQNIMCFSETPIGQLWAICRPSTSHSNTNCWSSFSNQLEDRLFLPILITLLFIIQLVSAISLVSHNVSTKPKGSYKFRIIWFVPRKGHFFLLTNRNTTQWKSYWTKTKSESWAIKLCSILGSHWICNIQNNYHWKVISIHNESFRLVWLSQWGSSHSNFEMRLFLDFVCDLSSLLYTMYLLFTYTIKAVIQNTKVFLCGLWLYEKSRS